MLSERIKIVKGLAPAADRFNTDPATDVISLKNAERATFLIIHAGGTTGKATITVEECDNVTPSNSTAIAFKYRRMTTGASDTMGAISTATAAGIDTVAAEDTIIEVSVEAADLSDGYPFVRVVLTEAADDPVNACVVGLLDGVRYQGDSMISALS